MIALIFILRFVSAFECGAHEFQERYPPISYPPQEHARKLSTYSTRNQQWEPIRVHFEYIDDLPGFTTEQFTKFKDEVMFFVTKHLETSLLVQRRKDDAPIQITCNGASQCICGQATMPEYITSTGVANADMVLITYTGYDAGSGWVARAGACYLDSTHFNNPMVGSVEINLAVWDFDDAYENQHGVMIHEVYHALGMSGSEYLMAEWVSDEQGTKRGTQNISREYTNSMGVDMFRIITPKVAEKAQEIYACDTLDGLDMENQGGSGTLGSHWEKRLISDDFMTGHIGWHDPTYSAITLAFMEDSGWYKAVWERAMVQVWGNGEGCDFIDNTCINTSTKASNFPEFYCTDLDSSTQFCDHNHLQIGYCNRISGMNPDARFDYFGDGSAGTDSLLDGCPVVSAYSNKNCRDINATPYSSSNYIGEVTGPNSRCITGTFMPPGWVASTQAICVEVKQCQSDRAVLRLQAMAASSSNSNTGHDEVEFECPFSGGQVTPTGWSGSIDCPASSILCDEVPCMNFCHGLGNCVNSQCVCDLGWGGDDCGIQCDSSCYNCSATAADNCTTCETGKELNNGTCVTSSGGCTDPCETCDAANSSSCTSCKNSLTLDGDQCVSSCIAPKIDVANVCTACTAPCATCETTVTTCVTCVDQAQVVHNGSCVSSCPSGTVQVGSACNACTGDCETCETNETTCITCLNGLKQEQGACQAQCTADTYAENPNGICTPCTSPCATCTGDETTCVTCLNGLKQEQGACLSSCTADTYIENPTDICSPCQSPCATCTGDVTTCVTCLNGLKQEQGACQAECTADTYIEDPTGVCTPCTSPCLTCTGDVTTCASCISGKVLDDTQWDNECPNGKFASNYICVDCNSPCTSCVTTADNCTACESAKRLSGNQCVDTCPSGTVDDGTYCISCSGSEKIHNGSCVDACPSGSYADSEYCINWHTNCAECSSNTETSCTSCKTDDALPYLSGTSCVASCASNQMLLNGQCQDCTGDCLTCQTNVNNCLTCSGGKKQQTGQCVIACSNEFIDDNDVCDPCTDPCATCTNTVTECSSCTGSKVLDGTTCLDQCPDGKYNNSNVCSDCDSACETCSGSSTTCTKCESPKKLYQSGCVDSCPENSIDAGDVCNTCPNGQKMYQGNCQDTWPSATYVNSYQQCLDCPTGCATCTSDTVCNSCQAKYYLRTDDLCAQCYTECLSCTGNGSDQCTACDTSHQLLFTDNTQTTIGLCVCNSGYYWSSSQQKCLQKPNTDACDASTYFDEGQELCLSCHSDCVECSGSTQIQCTYCPYDRQFVQNTSAATSDGIQGNCNCYEYEDQANNVCKTYDCPDGFYLDISEYGKAPVCRICHANCATCAYSADETACTSCPNNREITTGNYRDICQCKYEYTDLKTGECLSSVYVDSSSYCPLTAVKCNDLNDTCSWSSSGTLVSPISEDCIQRLYEWCWFDEQNALCSGIGYNFNQCSLLNPQPISAKFNIRGDRIKVKFDKAIIVNPSIVKCSQMFADWTEYAADCYAQIVNRDAARKKIFIDLYCGAPGQLNVGDTIRFNPDVFKSTSVYDDGMYNTDQPDITLTAPNKVQQVKIRVSAPSVISNCEQEFFIDASNSKGAACTGLNYQWSLTGLTENLPELGSYNSWDGIIQIPLIYYQSSSGITVDLTASNRLGATVTTSFTIAIQTDSVPLVELPYDTIAISRGTALDVEIFPSVSTCSGEGTSTFQYKFEALSDPKPNDNIDWESIWATFSANSRILTIPANSLSSGNTYTIRISVSTISNPHGYGYADLNIEVADSSLEINVANGNRIIGSSTSVTLSAQNSRDPDDESNETTANWTWRWTCEDWTNFGETCALYGNGVNTDELDEDYVAYYQEYVPVTCLNTNASDLMASLNSAQDTLEIPEYSIPEFSQYYFVATATKGSRSSSGYAWLQSLSGITSSVTIVQESRYLNSTDINTLLALVVSDSNEYVLQWEVENEGTSIDFLNPPYKTELAFDGNQLKPETVYKFTCTLREGLQTLISSTEMTINSPPINGIMQISPQTGTIDTDFSVSFLGWEDREENYPLVYKVIIVPDNPNEAPQVKTWSFNNNIKGLNFPAKVGEDGTETVVTIRGEIYDIYGGKTQTEQQSITMDNITTNDACNGAYNAVIKWSTYRGWLSYKEQLDLLTQAASLSKECGYDESLIARIEEIVAAMDINQMTFDELEQYSTYFGVTPYASDGAIINSNLHSMMTKMSGMQRTPSLFFLQNVVQTACKLDLFGSGRRRLTEDQEEDTLKQVGELALKNRVPDVPLDISSDNAKIRYEKKDADDLVKDGFSVTIEGPDNTSGSNRLRRRLSATNPNKQHEILVPAQFIINSEDVYTTQTQISQGTNEEFNGGIRATLDLKFLLTDSNGNVLSPNVRRLEDEQSCITYTYGLFDLEEYAELGIQSDTWTFGSSADFSFQCQALQNGSWTPDGFDQTKTVVDWVNKSVSCCATTFLGKTSVTLNKVQAETSPVISDIKIIPREDDDSNDYDSMETFSPVYLSIILIVICTIVVVLESIRDYVKGSSKNRVMVDQSANEADKSGILDTSKVEKLNESCSIQKEDPLHDTVRLVDVPNGRLGSDKQELRSSVDNYAHVAMWSVQNDKLSPEHKSHPNDVIDIKVNVSWRNPNQIDQKSPKNYSFLLFIWDFSILGLILGKDVRGFHRSALLSMICVSLQISMLICPLILELDFEFYYAGFLAAAIVSPLDALVSVVIMSARHAVVTFKIILLVILFGLQAVVLGLTWYTSEDYGETMNNDLMLAAGPATGALLVIIHPITLAIKYGIYKCQGKLLNINI